MNYSFIRKRTAATLVFALNISRGAAAADDAPPGADTSGDSRFGPPKRAEPKRSLWGVYVAGSGALENAALAAALGGRFRVSDHFLVGLDAEYNPWVVRRTGDIRPGVASLYATGILRFPLRFERVNLRSTLHLGATRMMFDLFGVPEGSIGPYIGFNLLGIDYELTRSLYLVVDPADIAIPIPQTSGVPFSYPQYRVTVGLQWGA